MEIKVLTFRLPKTEKDRLDKYCEKTGRTITDVIRELIRALPD